MEDIVRVGILGFLLIEALLQFTPFEAVFEAVAAIAFVAAVIFGFAPL
jgi:hypothetical protein